MKPIILKGHERSITMVKYNREGDLIFSCAKDHHPSVWYADNGERLGTYDGHNGAVWACDPSYHSKVLLTGSADTTAKAWDVRTGSLLATFTQNGPCRNVSWALGDKSFVTVCDPFMSKPAMINIYHVPEDIHAQTLQASETPEAQVMQSQWQLLDNASPDMQITDHGFGASGKITGASYFALNTRILATGGDGSLSVLDASNGALLAHYTHVHSDSITNVSWNHEKTMCLTSSKDNTAKLLDVTNEFKVLKTYETDRPVNGASISPLKAHVVLGGGQEAMSVTTTSGRVGKFEARFFSMVYAEEFARVKGHFGPINTISFAPDGRSYVSGAEDGYIRLHHFDAEYFAQYPDLDKLVQEANKTAMEAQA